MGDRAFARARAAGKNETEAGHARAKAEADIALSLPAEYRDWGSVISQNGSSIGRRTREGWLVKSAQGRFQSPHSFLSLSFIIPGPSL